MLHLGARPTMSLHFPSSYCSTIVTIFTTSNRPRQVQGTANTLQVMNLNIFLKILMLVCICFIYELPFVNVWPFRIWKVWYHCTCNIGTCWQSDILSWPDLIVQNTSPRILQVKQAMSIHAQLWTVDLAIMNTISHGTHNASRGVLV